MIIFHKCIICQENSILFLSGLFDDRYGALGKHSIYRCEHCGFGRTIPGLKSHVIAQFYSKYYPLSAIDPATVKSSAKLISTWLRWLTGTDNIAHLYIKPNTKVLDIGSGSGVSLLEIRKLGGIGFGIEPDPNAQVIAKKLRLNVFQGFISDNPFPEVKFDYITASQVIEHDPDPIAFLNSARQRLRKGGKIILSFPNTDSIYQKIFRNKWLNWHVPYHLSFLTKKSLNIAADKAGLEIRKIRTITPNLWTVLQIRMYLSPVLEGKKNPIWVSSTKTNSKSKSNGIVTSLLIKSIPVVIFLLAFVNRVIDFLGWGDSYLVFLGIKNEQ